MSRVAKNPVVLPKGVDVTIEGHTITVKGGKGTLKKSFTKAVHIKKTDHGLEFAPDLKMENADAIAGTTRAVVHNMVEGVSKGFERKLVLVGVGYRAQAQGKMLALTVGHSHPVNYSMPEGVTVKTPSQTEIFIEGADKEVVGQVAAEIRDFRGPEPYKGKGIRYSDEKIILKEAKKK